MSWKKKLLAGLMALLAVTVGAQVMLPTGETMQLSRLWDGTDVALVDAAGNLMVGDGSGPLTVDGTVTVTDGAGALNVIVDSGSITANAGTNLNTSALALDATLTNRLPAGATPADNESNAITTTVIRAYCYIFDGSAWDRCVQGNGTAAGASRVTIASDSTGQIKITDGTTVAGVIVGTTALKTDLASIAGTATPTGNGTAATSQRVTIASDNTVFGIKLDQTGANNDVDILSIIPGTAATNLGKAEDVGSASGDTGVLFLGMRKDAAAQSTNADGDYAAPTLDAYGTLFIRQDHNNRIRCTVVGSTATTLTAFGGSCATPGAGLSLYITDINGASTAASTAATADAQLTIKYGTGGTCGTGTTLLWLAQNTANLTVIDHYNTPLKVPANNELCWIDTIAGTRTWVISGFIAP